jgi:uncharacterized protein (DUF2236 family)
VSGAAPEPLGPESLVWQLGFARTALLYAGRSLLLQVAHPVVGAGVRDFSGFAADPWHRLDRTVRSLRLLMFGGPDAPAEAERLRRLHRRFTGYGFAGERYAARDPEAWAWVHLVNYDSAARYLDALVRPLSPAERQRHYADWRRLGLLLGVRPDALPPNAEQVSRWVDEAVRTRLTDNPSCRAVLGALALRGVGAPPAGHLPEPVWAAVRPLGGRILSDFTVGTLPPALRDRLGCRWTPADERRLDALHTAVRYGSRLVPERLLHYPDAYRAMQAARRSLECSA